MAARQCHRGGRVHPGADVPALADSDPGSRRCHRLDLDPAMKIILIYLLLVKATLTSFSGMSSLPVIRGDFVLKYHMLTNRELNTAVAAGRLGPGPIGLYVVSVGYFAAGLPGACAGWLAMVTPAFLIIPMLRFIGKRAQYPRVRSVIRAMVLASAGLLIFAALPLARDAVTG